MPRLSPLVLLASLAMLAISAAAQTVVLTPNSTSIGATGGTLTFTATITYSSAPSVLAFSATLPTGWTYLSGVNEPNVKPSSGTTGELGWIYTTSVPTSPATFTFTASYPAGLTGLQPLTTQTVTRATVESPPVTTAGPTVVISAPPTAFTWVGDGTQTGNWTDSSKWNPSGTVPNNTGNSTYSAQLNAGTATIPSGANIAISELFLLGGNVAGPGTLTLTGPASSWTNGAFSALGLLTIDGNAQLTASTLTVHPFDATAVVNKGVFNWVDGGSLSSGNGGSFTNNAGATFTDATSAGAARLITNGFGGSFSFINAGTYAKTVSGSLTRIEVPFINTGTVRVDAGTLRFTSSFTQNGGVLNVASGATAAFDNGLSVTVGNLIGGGAITGNVTVGSDPNTATPPAGNAALITSSPVIISPGNTLGQLNITGNLSLLSTAQLLVDLGGTTQGVNYDFLSVSGAAALGGTLSINFANGFASSVSPSTTFTVLTANTLTGAFANVPLSGTRILTNDGVSSFLVNYTANSVTLTNFVPIPEPSTWALLIAGLGVFAVGAWRRRQ